MRSLRSAGMSPPDFRVVPDAVDVVVPRQSLLSAEVVRWIGGLGEIGLSDHQHLALAMMRLSGTTSNARLRTWGVDRIDAGSALRDLVVRRLAVKSGGRRYAAYRLPDVLPTRTGLELNLDAPAAPAQGRADDIVSAIAAGHATTKAITEVTGLTRRVVLRRLAALIDSERVERVGATNSPHLTYRLTPPQKTP